PMYITSLLLRFQSRPASRPRLAPSTTLFRSQPVDGPGLPHAGHPGPVLRGAVRQQALFQGGKELLRPLATFQAGHSAQIAHLGLDRKSTRLNSSHVSISYAVIGFYKTTGCEI